MLRTLIAWLCLSFGGLLASMPASAKTVLVLGDSLSAGYGLDAGEGWVSLLEQKLKSEGLPHRLINASVSGETTAGGLARLPALLDRHKPAIVLIELGANDGLRALPLKQLRSNLERLVDTTRNAGAEPVLFEMRIPENYGASYTEAFTRSFHEVAQAREAALVPFLLAAIATDPDAFQDDGIHPSAASQPRILELIWPSLAPLLGASRTASAP